MGRTFVEPADGARAGVVHGVGGARDVVGIARLFGIGDGVVLHIAHEYLRARLDVVSGIPAQALDFVEAAPDDLVDLHDADAAGA